MAVACPASARAACRSTSRRPSPGTPARRRPRSTAMSSACAGKPCWERDAMAVKELTSAPSLATLYSKALLGGLMPGGKGGNSLPDTEFVRSGVAVDLAQLAAYNQVCGLRLADELPATYPHMLAFGLQMALMT